MALFEFARNVCLVRGLVVGIESEVGLWGVIERWILLLDEFAPWHGLTHTGHICTKCTACECMIRHEYGARSVQKTDCEEWRRQPSLCIQ